MARSSASSEPLIATARLALAEAGDPTNASALLDLPRSITAIERRPRARRARVEWAVRQLVHHAASGDPARCYRSLRELVAAVFEPAAGVQSPRPRVTAPAPDIALTLTPGELLAALAPPPRVIARELARGTAIAATAELADADPAVRLAALRAMTRRSIATHAAALAAAIARDPEPYIRSAALALVAGAATATKQRVADELAAITPTTEAAIDAVRQLGGVLTDARLAADLAATDRGVRAAAARVVARHGQPLPLAEHALVEWMAELAADPRGWSSALLAVPRVVERYRARLIAPLRTIALYRDGDPRPAVFLLAKLGDAEGLVSCVLDGRSDVAHTAAQLGGVAIEQPRSARIVRAERELASGDAMSQLAGLAEARRLGGRELIAAIKSIVVTGNPEAAALARDILTESGEPLPAPPHLTPYRGIAPEVSEAHGAYVIARAGDALGLWDAATGALVCAIDRAQAVALLPARSELAAVRDDCFERYAIPSGERLSSLAIPLAFGYGVATKLSFANDLVTVWCADRSTGYRFHVKLDPDRILDQAPLVGRKRPR